MSISILAEKLNKIKARKQTKREKEDEYYNLPRMRGAGILEDYSPTGKRREWEQKKQLNLLLFNLYVKALKYKPYLITESRLQNLHDCGNTLEFAVNPEGQKRLQRAFFCRNRLCPICAWRRSLKLFGQVSKITELVMREHKDIRFLFVTFTQRNIVGEQIAEALDDLNKAFLYIASKNRTFAPAKKLKVNLLGYIKNVEITYNSQSDTYHPHIHALFAVKPAYFKDGYIKAVEWSTMWQQAKGLHYLPSVNIQAINMHRSSKAVAELTKYPAKVAPLLQEQETVAIKAIITLTELCYKRRFVSFGGVFKSARQFLRLPDVEAQNVDLIHAEQEITQFNAVARVMYKYNARMGVYINA